MTTLERIQDDARKYAIIHSAAPDKDTPDWMAPHIQTPEEAFYVSWVIASDVFGAIMTPKMKP